MKYTNPIIRGFYPDPSICYRDGYYYLVCSSFQYFPGIPLFKSKNLKDWAFVCHVLQRKSQLQLETVQASGGIFAPTIRVHNNRFYVVVTNVNHGGNFYVYTDDLNVEFSDPIYVDQGGIDPTLFFDDDQTFFLSNGVDDVGKEGITICTIDIETGRKLSKSICISNGCGGRYVEGPHLYKIDNIYYLLVAEGGTEFGHMESILRSSNLMGPYEPCPNNPILTNRNLGGYFIQGCGHGDLIEGADGQWWMVHLAFRQIDRWQQYHHLGREVFLVPIYWNDGWPTVGTDGTTRATYEVTKDGCLAEPEAEYPSYRWILDPAMAIYLRSPDYSFYRNISSSGFYLRGSSSTLASNGNVTFLGMRQQEFYCTFELSISMHAMNSGQSAGITAYMDELHHYVLETHWEGDLPVVEAYAIIGGLKSFLGKLTLETEEAVLKIESTPTVYELSAQNTTGAYELLGTVATKYLSSEVASGFTGVILAAFCHANDINNNPFIPFTIF